MSKYTRQFAKAEIISLFQLAHLDPIFISLLDGSYPYALLSFMADLLADICMRHNAQPRIG